MSLSDDETLMESASDRPIEAEEAPADVPAPPPLSGPAGATPSRATDGAMETGTGADDEPELAIGDRDYEGDDLRVTPEEAERMLGGGGG